MFSYLPRMWIALWLLARGNFFGEKTLCQWCGNEEHGGEDCDVGKNYLRVLKDNTQYESYWDFYRGY
jgi:hypothetical protein